MLAGAGPAGSSGPDHPQGAQCGAAGGIPLPVLGAGLTAGGWRRACERRQGSAAADKGRSTSGCCHSSLLWVDWAGWMCACSARAAWWPEFRCSRMLAPVCSAVSCCPSCLPTGCWCCWPPSSDSGGLMGGWLDGRPAAPRWYRSAVPHLHACFAFRAAPCFHVPPLPSVPLSTCRVAAHPPTTPPLCTSMSRWRRKGLGPCKCARSCGHTPHHGAALAGVSLSRCQA